MDPYNQPTAPSEMNLRQPPYFQPHQAPPPYNQHQPCQMTQAQQPCYPQQQHMLQQQSSSQQIVYQQTLPQSQQVVIQQDPAQQKHIVVQQDPPPPQVIIQQPYSTTTVVAQQQQPNPVVATPFSVGYRGCRVNARVIAWIDIILSVICCIVFILALIAAHQQLNARPINVYGYRYYYESDSTSRLTRFYAQCVLCVLGLICYIIGLCIACQLLSATEPIAPPIIAIGKAKCWRNYNIFLLVITFISACLSSTNGASWGTWGFLFFLVRIICVYVVQKFIQNLEYSHFVAPVAVVGITSR